VFDDAVTRQRHISVLVHEAQQLGYPVRYWWLSESMELQGSPDRLIVCVHHPALSEDAGMDLYNALSQAAQKHKVTWDGLEAAHVDEYRQFGKIIFLDCSHQNEAPVGLSGALRKQSDAPRLSCRNGSFRHAGNAVIWRV
jgi:hypothetical protein